MGLWKEIKKAAKDVGDAATDAAEDAVDAISDAANSSAKEIGIAVNKTIDAVKRAAQAAGSSLLQLRNIFYDVFNRIISLPDIILTLLGIMLPKQMRIHGIPLRDGDNIELATGPEMLAPRLM